MMAYGEDIAPPERPVVVRKTAPQKNVDRFEERKSSTNQKSLSLSKMILNFSDHNIGIFISNTHPVLNIYFIFILKPYK